MAREVKVGHTGFGDDEEAAVLDGEAEVLGGVQPLHSSRPMSFMATGPQTTMAAQRSR